MKQILPFKKELLFKTKVCEITSISLEHNLSLKSDDLVSGEFIITGDYKMTEGSINRENFTFKLPFDIALDSRYDAKSMVIDIDNFYYEIVNNEAIKVNIDVYIEGTKIEIEEKNIEPIKEEKEEEKVLIENNSSNIEESNDEVLLVRNKEEDTMLFKEEFSPSVSLEVPKKVTLTEENTYKEGANIFENIDATETYATYYVYIVKEGDSLEKILEKYNVTKESLSYYNNLDNINPGTKLIIPDSNNE